VGTGVGFALSVVQKYVGGPFVMLGTDISLRMLQVAREREKEATFVQFDGERLPIGNGQCNAVLLVSILHHAYDPFNTLLVESARILCAKGYLVVAQEPNRFVNGPLRCLRKLLRVCPSEETMMTEYHQFQTSGISLKPLVAKMEQLELDVLRMTYTNAALADELENKLGALGRCLSFPLLRLKAHFLSVSYSLIAQKREPRLTERRV